MGGPIPHPKSLPKYIKSMRTDMYYVSKCADFIHVVQGTRKNIQSCSNNTLCLLKAGSVIQTDKGKGNAVPPNAMEALWVRGSIAPPFS
jgi:hypothetical protein